MRERERERMRGDLYILIMYCVCVYRKINGTTNDKEKKI